MLSAVRQLLQFGPDVEVLAPPEARTELRRAAAAIADLCTVRLTAPTSAR